MNRIPQPGTFYRHFKNKLYQVIAVATHSETGEKMVVYQALYGDYQVYVRPLEMFISPVDREKYPDVEQEYRFEQVFPGQMNELGKNGNKPATGNLAGYDQTQQPEEPMSHEWLERFLDADCPEDQLAVLKQMEGHVTQKELDCIFVSQYVAKDFPNLPVGTDELVLVTSLDHPLADQLTVSFADIDGQDFVLSADDFDYETGKLFRLNHITPNVRFRINEDYTAIKMVEQGFGITVLPKLLLHNIPFNVCVRSFTEHFRRNLSVAYLDTPELSPALDKFLTFVTKWAKECKLI